MRTGLTLIKEYDGIKFYGEIANIDVMKLKLDPIDLALLDDVKLHSSIADQLLVLEMLFRRIGEQYSEQTISY